MSTSSAANKIQQINSDVTRIHGRRADIARSVAQETEKISRATERMSRSSSLSTTRSAQQDVERARRAQADLSKRDASEARDLARRQEELARAQKELLSEQQKEMKKSQDEIRKGQDLIKRMESEARSQSSLKTNTFWTAVKASQQAEVPATPQKQFTAFISHASEDKAEIARPLAECLRSLGHTVWFDELTLKVGDSLRRKIDHGLASSRFGIVILSPSFFSKGWPQYELDGMVAREVGGSKVILPVWHKVTKSEVLQYSPSLADKIALSTALFTPEDIAKQIHEVLVTPTESQE